MNTLKLDRLRSTQTSVGTWLSIGSPVIAELAAECGFDWLLFDLEHGCGTEASLLSNLQAIRGSASVPVVRVGAPNPDLILRVLDWGAQAIMVPHIESAAAAQACVEAIHYPPRGRRGFSRSGRAYGYGVRPPLDGDAPPKPLFIAQIETLEGVRESDTIAAQDGVDMLFVGPADLGFDLQARPQPSGPDFDTCLRTVTAAARTAGKPAGILVRRFDDLPRLRSFGFSHFAIDSDLAILRNHYQQLLARTSEVSANTAAVSPPSSIVAST